MGIRRNHWLLLIALLAVTLGARPAQTQPRPDADPALRGLDVYIHAPNSAPAGGTLPLALQVVGFARVDAVAPLADAVVQLAWDPEHLGPHNRSLPPAVSATADANGQIAMSIEVPNGDPHDLKLLVEVSHGGHQRTQVLPIARLANRQIEVHVGDPMVVPGSTVSAWLVARNRITGLPIENQTVDVELLEGGVARHKSRVRTDAAGAAVAQVPIPKTTEPGWSWQLRGALPGIDGAAPTASAITLRVREETPGTPSLKVHFDQASVSASAKAPIAIRLLDAAQTPVVAHRVYVWAGPRGTQPPEEEKFIELAKPLDGTQIPLARPVIIKTDLGGRFEGSVAAPDVVAPQGTEIVLYARTKLSGRALEGTGTVAVGKPTASVELFAESSGIVPNVDQQLMLVVSDDDGKPVQSRFEIEADGLRTEVTTNPHGEGFFQWKPPPGVGAARDVGPCASAVAASVRVRPLEPATFRGGREQYDRCLVIERERDFLVRVAPPVAAAGAAITVFISGPPRPRSIVLESADRSQSITHWIDGTSAEVALPKVASGIWQITAAAPGTNGKPQRASASILVVPERLPRLTAEHVGGRATPNGRVKVHAAIKDQNGAPLTGSVAAVVFDRFGGGSDAGLHHLDERRKLCAAVQVEVERCDEFLGGQAESESQRGVLSMRTDIPRAPTRDPGAALDETLRSGFSEVVMSLEGAVFLASHSRDSLIDIRRKVGTAWRFNPELMTLVTAAMNEPPLTPGGEVLSLSDLIAIDSQVEFNNVARRISRLKLFQILKEVRALRRDTLFDNAEPALRHPEAIVRNMLRDGQLTDGLMLDPWGGSFQFVPSRGAPQPFLSVIPGFELRSPGPDGRINTADDISDPFMRVLRSGSRYADAVKEDILVDAQYNIEVSEATLAQWDQVLSSLTGTELGSVGTIGLGSVGTIGHGSGFGSGHGGLGRSKRARITRGITTDVSYWSAPVRTDNNGEITLDIPLGAIETTYRIALVAFPDSGRSASTAVDIPVSLPLSTRVELGDRWVTGDKVQARVSVRNRTTAAIEVALDIHASGAITADQKVAQRVRVEAQSERDISLPLSANRAGSASVKIKATAPGLPPDVAEHRFRVHPAGELTSKAYVEWVEDRDTDLAPWLTRSKLIPLGPPTLVVETTAMTSLPAVLRSIDPDRLSSAPMVTDAIEISGRIHDYALQKYGKNSLLAQRASDLGRMSTGRFIAFNNAGGDDDMWALLDRVHRFGPAGSVEGLKKPPECPPEPHPNALSARIEALDGEPAVIDGNVMPCWTTFVTDTITQLRQADDPVLLAQAVIALDERTHRSAMAKALIRRLQSRVALQPNGMVTLGRGGDRADRSIVYAALLLGRLRGEVVGPSAPALEAWLTVQRDFGGGFGSTLATRSAVRALLEAEQTRDSTPKPTITIDLGDDERVLDVDIGKRLVLSSDVETVDVDVESGGAFFRLERTFLRPWSVPAPDTGGPLRLTVDWPEAKSGQVRDLHVFARTTESTKRRIEARIPLPPGVSLATPVSGVRQVQGALLIRTVVETDGAPLDIPLRFGLRAEVTVPEATMHTLDGHLPRAVARSRRLSVQ